MFSEFISFTKSKHPEKYFVQNHLHNCYELVYYLSGSGKTVINNKTYEFFPDTFAVISPHEIHNESADESVNLMFIGFDIGEYSLKSGLYSDANGVVKDILKKIHVELNERNTHFKYRINLLTELLIFNVLRFDKRTENTEESGFEYAKNYIVMNANMHTTIQNIAANLGYNYDYFRQLFISKMNVSAKTFFLREKLKNVKDCLTDTEYSIKKIALITGFSSASHMCAVFKKHYGISPEEYRLSKNPPPAKTIENPPNA